MTQSCSIYEGSTQPDTRMTNPFSPWSAMSQDAHHSGKVPLSIVLQGNVVDPSSNIFLFPDGSGSGLAYAKLPLISPNVCLIAMNSPFLADAKHYTCSIEQCARLWFDELRRMQPRGPYTLGGWSAGGYYAFEMAKALLAVEEEVQALVLIDSPCRLLYEALPMTTVRELAMNSLMGTWDTGAAPRWMLDHFESTIAAVHAYNPTPIARKGIHRVYLIWAKDGVNDNQATKDLGIDFRVKINQLLLRPRTNFTAMGWETLLPETEILAGKMDGNHFQLVQPPYVRSLNRTKRNHI
jgi:thioesterase domain-containing protein